MRGQVNATFLLLASFFAIITTLTVLMNANGIAWAASDHYSDNMVKDLWLRIINFSALITILMLLVRKPLKKSLTNRIQSIKDELTNLESKKNVAEIKLIEAEKRLKEAEVNHKAILTEFRTQGEKEQAAIITAAKNIALRIKTQAQFTIDQEIALAKAELRKEVAYLSTALAKNLLIQKITTEDQARLVDEYLGKVQQEVQ